MEIGDENNLPFIPKIPLCFVNVSNDELEQTLTFLLSEGLQNVHT